ncbi:MAG: hypothetical protein QM817_21455 [Archangium sp.]
MNRLIVVLTFALSTLAFADAKEDAQKKIDEAMAQSCDLAKKNVTTNKEVCADEFAKLDPVDCQNKDQRKASDFLKVNGECTRKMKDAAKSGSLPKKEGDGEKKKGSHCKVLDDSGTVVAELDSEGTSVKCNTEIREKVKAEKCEPGKKLEFKFIGEALGKETKPTNLTVTCPKK